MIFRNANQRGISHGEAGVFSMVIERWNFYLLLAVAKKGGRLWTSF